MQSYPALVPRKWGMGTVVKSSWLRIRGGSNHTKSAPYPPTATTQSIAIISMVYAQLRRARLRCRAGRSWWERGVTANM